MQFGEAVRRCEKNLTVTRMTPDAFCDRTIGLARKSFLSCADKAGAGLLRRMRATIGNDWQPDRERRTVLLRDDQHLGVVRGATFVLEAL